MRYLHTMLRVGRARNGQAISLDYAAPQLPFLK